MSNGNTFQIVLTKTVPHQGLIIILELITDEH